MLKFFLPFTWSGILCIIGSGSAFALTGSVMDDLGTPLSGVNVRFVFDGSSVVTDFDGSFSLSSATTSTETSLPSFHFGVSGNLLTFSLPEAEKVDIRTFDVLGHQMNNMTEGQLTAGVHQFAFLEGSRQAAGVYVVEYRFGVQRGTVILAVNPSQDGRSFASVHSTAILRLGTATVIDSVRFSKTGFVTVSVAVFDYSADLGEVVMGSAFVGSSSSSSEISYGTLNDTRDGQTYKTVMIGTQTWMAQNLNYDTLNGIGSWCFNDNADSCTKYGRLYDWATAMGVSSTYNYSTVLGDSVNHRGICPQSWHMPNSGEWQTLYVYMGANNGDEHVGISIRSIEGWSTEGTDRFGFSALPAGSRCEYGMFNLATHSSYTDIVYSSDSTGFWSATELLDFNSPWTLYNGGYDFYPTNGSEKVDGYGIRCLKDVSE